MKIVLTREDVGLLLRQHIFKNYYSALDITGPNDVQFNDYNLPYGDLVFEKKVIREVKLEDVEDMVIEQLKVRGEQDAV